MTFEEWFYQNEAWGSRSERCYADLSDNPMSMKALTTWLNAAYQEGYKEAKKEFYNPEITGDCW